MAIITGTVKNDNNEPLSNVHVFVPNSNPLRGVLTTENGKYLISVLPYEKLAYSYAGTQQEKQTSSFNQEINIVFESNSLPEISLSATVNKKKSSNLLLILLALSLAGNIYQANKKSNIKK